MKEEWNMTSNEKDSGENMDKNKKLVTNNIIIQIKNHDSQLFNSCYDTIRNWITKDEELDTQNILAFTVRVMTLVQNMSTDKGPYKKMLAIDLIKRLVVEINYSDELIRKATLEFIETNLPSFIDVSVGLARGDIDIGKNIKTVKKCFARCC